MILETIRGGTYFLGGFNHTGQVLGEKPDGSFNAWPSRLGAIISITPSIKTRALGPKPSPLVSPGFRPISCPNSVTQFDEKTKKGYWQSTILSRTT